jgi:hypothetical protein
MAQTRRRSVAVARRYIRDGSLFRGMRRRPWSCTHRRRESCAFLVQSLGAAGRSIRATPLRERMTHEYGSIFDAIADLDTRTARRCPGQGR